MDRNRVKERPNEVSIKTI